MTPQHSAVVQISRAQKCIMSFCFTVVATYAVKRRKDKLDELNLTAIFYAQRHHGGDSRAGTNLTGSPLDLGRRQSEH